MGDSLGDNLIVAFFGVEVAAEGIGERRRIQQLNKVLGPMRESILIIILKRRSILKILFGITSFILIQPIFFNNLINQILLILLSPMILEHFILFSLS